jgi:hypothetical protein
MRLGVSDDFIEFLEIEAFAWFINVDPASLTAQIAAVENREVEEGREVDPFFHPPLVEVH